MVIGVLDDLKPRGSTGSAPPRRADSVRRTTTRDFTWPDGLQGDTVLDGRARDLRTSGDGTASVLAQAALGIVIGPQRMIREISSTPELAPGPGRRLGHVRLPAAAGRRAGASARLLVLIQSHQITIHEQFFSLPVPEGLERRRCAAVDRGNVPVYGDTWETDYLVPM
jgi:hypothetical protein